MRSLAITGVALAALAVSQPAFAGIDSSVGAPAIVVPTAAKPAKIPAVPQQATGAATAMPSASHAMRSPRPLAVQPDVYQRPAYGYRLPGRWQSAEYFLADYRRYGLPDPAAGFGWSRYYDDAVLTDQWGRVYDAHSNFDWNRQDDHRDYGHGRDRFDTQGLAGGIGGAAVGAVAGNLIAGTGSRLAGSLIGGGVGAIAGLAIETALSKHHRRPHHDHVADDRYHDDYYRGPHWGGGYVQDGGYDAAPPVTTIVIRNAAPTIGYRTVTTYETVYARRAPRKHHYRPRPKPACACGS